LKNANKIDIEKKKAEIGSREKGFEESIRGELIKELRQPANKLPKRVKFILEAQRVGCDFEDSKRQEQYYKRAREFFNKGSLGEKVKL